MQTLQDEKPVWRCFFFILLFCCLSNSLLWAASILPAPVIGSASSIHSKGFSANWMPVNNAAGYTVKIFYGTTFVDSINVIGQTVTTAICTNLVPNTTFSYKVMAKGDGLNYSDSPLSESSGVFTLLSAAIPTNKLKFIIKLDDFSRDHYALPVLDYALANNLKLNLGIIAKTIDASSQIALAPYLRATNQNGDSLIELWHHGLDHSNPSLNVWEFKNSTYADQKLHFDSADAIVKRVLGVQMHTFGAPYNAADANTNAVLLTNPNYKVIMLAWSTTIASSLLDMKAAYVTMETKTGVPFYKYFVTNYLNNKASNTCGYMLTQGHPNYYTLGSANLDQFKLIVNFLISEGVEFVRAYDYYRYLSLKAPSNLTGMAKGANSNSLSWTDNSTTESSFVIERSTDNVNWTKVGITLPNVTTFEDKSQNSIPISYYRVCANCGVKSDYSTVCKIVNNTTDIHNEEPNSDNVRVYQKFNKIIVSGLMNVGERYSCELYDTAGVVAYRLNSNLDQNSMLNLELDSKELKSGLYFCRIQSNKECVTQKIFLQLND